MKTKSLLSAALVTAMLGGWGLPAWKSNAQPAADPASAKLNRTDLPIPEPDYPRSKVLVARDTKAPPRSEVRAPAGVRQRLSFLTCFQSHLGRQAGEEFPRLHQGLTGIKHPFK